MIYASIDIGSNAGRLLIGNVTSKGNKTVLKKFSLTRVPLRLGEDVFTKKKISRERTKMLMKTLKAYKLLIEAYQIKHYRACATSAMREASNGKQIVARVRREIGLNLELIGGDEEANLIFSTFNSLRFPKKASYLYIDVGGGSTELTLIENGQRVASKSFKIGTIRMLKGKVGPEKWEQLNRWIKKLNPEHHEITAIGTGGNINRILKINRGDSNNMLQITDIKRIQKYLKEHTLEERMNLLGLRPDRADVIIPAAEIYLRVMRFAAVKQIIVPKVGLSDGIIFDLYKKNHKSK